MFLVGCQSYAEPAKEVETIKLDTNPIDTEQVANTTSFSEKRVIKFESGIIPTSVSIPSIDVEANILQVGLQEDGTMEVPEDVMEVGWYTNGAKPGQNGNVVLAGHVDSYLGPGIFFNLKNVSIDDEITISNGEEIIKYRVVKKESYPYDQGPLEEIFGFTTEKRMHLITCTGRYNPFSGNHEERLVVTAIAEG